MDRAEFTTEFRRALRYVLQKQERVDAARKLLDEKKTSMHELAYQNAQDNLDGAIDQMGDCLADAFLTIVNEGN